MSRWEEHWDLVRELPGGGQANAALVKPRDKKQPIHFLKILKDNRLERRERMRREIACYETLRHPRIPRLVESNVEEFDQPDVAPYLVSEYVGGQHLEEHVQSHGYLPAAEALAITFKLLDAVSYAHGQETVHRDIKPSNIVLRDDVPSEPVLVDFGMSFYEGEDQLTPGGQEVGNRFLRLPEFSASSANKRDPRSDVTLSAGILFYMLTGITPRNLRDERGSAPHQSPAARTALARHQDIDLPPLLDVFDRAFDPILHVRWDSAESLRTALRTVRIGVPDPMGDESADEMLAKLRRNMERHEEQRLQLRRAQLDQAFWKMREVTNALAREIPGLVTTQGGYTIDPIAGRATGTLGLLKASDAQGYSPSYLIELQGTELVVSFDGVAAFRCPAADVTTDAETLSSSSRTIFLRGLRERIGD